MFSNISELRAEERKRQAKLRRAREARAAAKLAKERLAFRDRCDAVIDGILALPAEPAVYLVEIPKLFAKAGRDNVERYSVFHRLDDQPGYFWRPGVEYWAWHSKLRQVRNHPIHGRELFAAINEESR